MYVCFTIFIVCFVLYLQVCGGGPHLSMWHMRSLSATTAFKTSDATHSFAMFYDDHVCNTNFKKNNKLYDNFFSSNTHSLFCGKLLFYCLVVDVKETYCLEI